MFQKLKAAWMELGLGAAEVNPARVAGDDEQWNKVVDVAVVGFGGAGVAAAIEARDQGAEVAVVDRFNGGGSTKISGGIVYCGGGTDIQQQAGVEDSPENMFNYLRRETAEVVSEETLRSFCEESPENFNWMLDQGVPFEASQCPFKTSYPSNNYYFYYSGNEAFQPYTDTATPAARGHRAHGKGVSGAALFTPMLESAKAKGVQILTQHRAMGLVTDGEGKVIGVEMIRFTPGSFAGWLHRQLYSLLIYSRYAAMYISGITWLLRAALEELESRHGKPFRLRARRGVVISTGGFFYNREMVQQYAPNDLPGMPLGTIGDDGSGILMGESVNAETALMDNVSQWRFVNPPESFIRGILVDSQGQRICNEMLYGAQINEQIMTKANGQAWLIIDSALVKQALGQIGPKRAMWFQSAAALMYLYIARRKAATVAQLADKLNMPAETLQKTIDTYNTLSRSSEDDPMGKPSDYHAVLEKGPWYALDCRVDGAVRNPSITLGGLKVDEKTGEVLTGSGEKIGGLYAAGRSAVGVASHSYVSGLSIADCIYSGRRAGKHAAEVTKPL